MHAAAYKNLPGAVDFLNQKGADIDINVWNKQNKRDWTPLAIAMGYRFGNFKPSAVTVAALQRIFDATGVAPAAMQIENRTEY